MPTPTQSATLASEAPSEVPSDAGSTQPTTPSSAVPPSVEMTQRTPTQPKAHRATKSVVPAVPILPQSPNSVKRTHRDSVVSTNSKASSPAATPAGQDVTTSVAASDDASPAADSGSTSSLAVPVVSPPAAPKSWADLVRPQATAPAANAARVVTNLPNELGGAKAESLSEVLNDMNASESEPASKVALLEPRGLVNTGNMCYMNSVSQIEPNF
jgi:ubiquitin carboxyl-terminal hydrolase 10